MSLTKQAKEEKMLNDNEILYIVPFTNVKVEKTALNKDIGGWSILTGEQLQSLCGDFKKVSLKKEKLYYYFRYLGTKENIKHKLSNLKKEELLFTTLLRFRNYNELDVNHIIIKGKNKDDESEYNPYRQVDDVKLLQRYPYIKDEFDDTLDYNYFMEKGKPITTSYLKKITPIIIASKKIPNSFYELLKIWNQSFDIDDPVEKTRRIYPIWRELIFNKKQNTPNAVDELLKILTGEYSSHYQMIANFIIEVNKIGYIDYETLYNPIRSLLNFKKYGSGYYKELFALFLGKYIIPMTQKIIWHSLLNLTTMGHIYPRYIKTEYDIPSITD